MPRLHSFRGALLAVAVLAATLPACSSVGLPFAIRTAAAEPQACMDALMAGSLERHALTGLGIGVSDVEITPVEWPFGYSARMEVSTIVLVDETGKVVAREHDRVQVGGGMGPGPAPNNVWFACGGVSVVSNEGG